MIINEKNINGVDKFPVNGEGNIIAKELIKEGFFNGISGFHVNTLEEGSLIGIHEHLNNQEIYYILDGKGDYYDNGEWRKVGKNDLLVCDLGHSHGLRANTDVKFIAFLIGEQYGKN